MSNNLNELLADMAVERDDLRARAEAAEAALAALRAAVLKAQAALPACTFSEDRPDGFWECIEPATQCTTDKGDGRFCDEHAAKSETWKPLHRDTLAAAVLEAAALLPPEPDR